jgi:hypothetical protein
MSARYIEPPLPVPAHKGLWASAASEIDPTRGECCKNRAQTGVILAPYSI